MAKEEIIPKVVSAINGSTSINRVLGISFLLFLFYISISIASTTDLMLFLPNSYLTLPVLGIDLPLKGFYIITPIVLLLFHYNLLINLQLHCNKLLRIRELTDDKEQFLGINPFLVNYLIILAPGVRRNILKGITETVAFTLPLLVLCYVLFQFSDYHSISISSFHLCCILLDLYLVYTHTTSIRKVFNLDDQLKANKVSIDHKLLWWVVSQLNKLSKKRIGSKVYGYLKNAAQYQKENLLGALGVLYFTWFLLVATGSFGNLPGYWQILEYSFPRITLDQEVLVKLSEQQKLIETDWIGLNKEEQFQQYSSVAGLDLSNRNFKHIELEGCILINANLEDSDMQFANMQGSVFFGSNVNQCNFSHSDLSYSNLTNISGSGIFDFCDLISVDFSMANLKYSKFRYSECSHSTFDSTKLHGTNMTGANLGNTAILNSSFKYATMIGVSFWQANIVKSISESGNFVGCSFKHANIVDCDFIDSSFDGANFESSSITNSVFNTASFNGSIFRFSNIDSTLFTDSSFAQSFAFAFNGLVLWDSLEFKTNDVPIRNPEFDTTGRFFIHVIDSLKKNMTPDTMLISTSDSTFPPLSLFYAANNHIEEFPSSYIDSLSSIIPAPLDPIVFERHDHLITNYDSTFLRTRATIILENPGAALTMFGNSVFYEVDDDYYRGIEDTLLFNYVKKQKPQLFNLISKYIPNDAYLIKGGNSN